MAEKMVNYMLEKAFLEDSLESLSMANETLCEIAKERISELKALIEEM